MKNCQPCARRAQALREMALRHGVPLPGVVRTFLEQKAATLDPPHEGPAPRETSAVEEAR